MRSDSDPVETTEWREAFDSVLEFDGADRAGFLLEELIDEARRNGAPVPYSANTPYLNTIPPSQEPAHPGDRAIEHRIRSLIRWNAVAIVLRANKESSELGGHIASFQSAATLYDTGFQHFWHAPSDGHGGDLLFVQGHCSPGIYARSFVEGRLSEEQLLGFRQEVGGGGLPSYPHPWLMPEYWQFPTVSMGLGPLMAIYQARFLKYLHNRELADTANRHVWAFLGDGEMDEPESLGAISLAGREKLDNLIFVVNCNLQRLDGPVRGNGKIIQELEAIFRGAGWNVVKVVWGSGWDPLIAADKTGLLLQRMEECVDGEYQDFKSKNGAYVREHFFGKYPELLDMVADMTDDEIWALARGGHDPSKVYAAYKAAVDHEGAPTVILAKTVKGYGMGEAGEGQNITHQQKKMGEDVLRQFRDRFGIDLPDEKIAEVPFLKLPEGSQEERYLHERREALGGSLPVRRQKSQALPVPELSAFAAQLKSTGDREISTTMAFVRILTTLLRDKTIGKHVVPIVPDESRTFGMEGLFRQFGIFSQVGQLYQPEDAKQLMYYKESRSGQMLQEGINEAGAMSSWIAAATSLHGVGRPDDPVLHLLLDVRVPADRRPGLGGRRLAGPRVPARRHRRADHAQRRGPATRGRPQPPHVGHHPQLRLLRPHLRPRGRGDRAGRAAPHVRRAGGRLLLPHRHERELPAPGHARGPGGRGPRGHHPRHVPAAGGTGGEDGPQGRAAGAAAGLRHHPARGHRRRRPAGARLRRRRRRVERAQLHRAAPRRDRRRTLEHAAPRRGAAARASSSRAWPGARPAR